MSVLASDPLRPLLDLPGVADAVAAARSAVDEVHRHPANRRGWPATAAEASVRAARASAAIEGGSTDIPEAGEVSEPVLAGSLRVAESIGLLLTTWQRAPLQALARLHVLAAADLISDQDALGRPRPAEAMSARLDLLAKLIAGGTGTIPSPDRADGFRSGVGVPQDAGVPQDTVRAGLARASAASGPILTAIVHGELLTLAPFGTADGVIARAAARLTAIGTGLDPKGLAVPEVGWLRRRSEYLAAAEGYASGEPDGVAGWIVHCCEAMQAGAREAISIADASIGS